MSIERKLNKAHFLTGSSFDLFSDAHNPNNVTCADAATCSNLFQFSVDGSPIPDTFVSAGMMSVDGNKCLSMSKATGGMIIDQQ